MPESQTSGRRLLSPRPDLGVWRPTVDVGMSAIHGLLNRGPPGLPHWCPAKSRLVGSVVRKGPVSWETVTFPKSENKPIVILKG